MRRLAGDYQVGGYRAGWVVTMAHHLLVVVVGVVGVVGEPSPSAVEVIGYDAAAYLWSVGFILMGASAAVAHIRRRILAEVIAVLGVVMFRFLWAVMIIAGGESGFDIFANPESQVGLSILAGGVFMLGWSLTTLVWLRTGLDPRTPKTPIEELRDHLRDSLEAHGGDPR